MLVKHKNSPDTQAVALGVLAKLLQVRTYTYIVPFVFCIAAPRIDYVDLECVL